MTKWRNTTPPVPGRVLQQFAEQIDELYRAISARGGLGIGGGFGGSTGAARVPQMEHGQGTTDGTGKVTVTFPQAFGSTPDVFVSVNNTGTDQLVAAVESVSTTTLVVSVGKIASQGTAGLSTGAGPSQPHRPPDPQP
jgi:hypothetical protein